TPASAWNSTSTAAPSSPAACKRSRPAISETTSARSPHNNEAMTPSEQRLPNFVVIGAAKSGTISLYHYLSQHPDLFMCPVNECNFFALETADWNKEYLGPVDRYWVDRHCVKTLEQYRKLFANARANQLIGESSPLYLFSDKAA